MIQDQSKRQRPLTISSIRHEASNLENISPQTHPTSMLRRLLFLLLALVITSATDPPRRLSESVNAGGGIISEFLLIDASLNVAIKKIENGETINLRKYGSPKGLNVEAVIKRNDVRSVKFTETNRTENVAPYAFCGDLSSDFYSCTPWLKIGPNTVTATAYDQKRNVLGNASITFTLADLAIAPTKAPVKPPATAPIRAPNVSPVRPPASVPVRIPTKSPIKPPAMAPVRAPVKPLPTRGPTKSPVKPPANVLTRAPARSPVKPQTKAPIRAPTRAPVKPPTKAPIRAPTKAPVKPPTKAPVKPPTKAPIKPPTKAPLRAPTSAPVKPPTKPPVKPPTKAPIRAPTRAPVKPPTKAPTRAPTKAPVRPPTKAPVKPPTKAPIRAPTKAPVKPPTKAPIRAPTKAPVKPPTKAPVKPPTKAPVKPPTKAPTRAPTNAPVKPPTKAPTRAPTKAPVKPPTKAPTRAPTKAPVKPPTKAPVKPPTKAPVTPPTKAPTRAPTNAPVKPPTKAPTRPPTKAPTVPFQTIRINVGGTQDYVDVLGHTWTKDSLFSGGRQVVELNKEIFDTQDDVLYQTSRVGVFQYNIPVPNGDYEIVLHFTELSAASSGERIFVAKAEGENLFGNIDIFAFGGFTLNRAVTMEKALSVADGSISLSVEEVSPKRGDPKLCGIEIKSLGPHLAHSVAGGPYTVVDTTGSGSAVVKVDGRGSHTHGPGLVLIEYVWRSGFNVLGRGEQTSFTLPVGVSPLTLTVRDNGGNEHTETTLVTVLPSEFPDIIGLSPSSGPLEGGTTVTIKGTGFGFSSADTTVKFGQISLTGSDIQVIDKTTIRLVTPASSVAVPVPVSVITPVGASSSEVTFTYVATNIPIDFQSGLLARIRFPTAVAFGPDRRLYIGTYTGELNRIEFTDGTLKIAAWVRKTVTPFRAILGIAFDPLDTASFPTPYISHSFFFHKDPTSSSGEAINGKISKVTGSNLDKVEDVIIGLPISDHDHGLNNIQFGDNGELYITVGGNTNAGLPGAMTSSLQQKENVLSAAILVAYVHSPSFNGNLKYDAPDDGNLVGGNGVELFCVGLRNAFGLVVHSNGNLYTNDNGANLDFGDIMLGCNGERMSDVEDFDKLIRLEKGNYYGHPNPKRATKDSRQCVWHASTEPSGNGYTAPMMTLESATGGMIEFMTNHFGGQLRGNLIYSHYNGALHRIILSANGKDVLPASNPALKLVGDFGLAVAQAPSGELIETRYQEGDVFFHRPIEPAAATINATLIKGVFPYRGARTGGTTLHIYGDNLNKNGQTPTVRVGGSVCAVTVVKAFRVACTLPSGSGTVDVQLILGTNTVTFPKSYRYIAGR